jgi:hypothetical protein
MAFASSTDEKTLGALLLGCVALVVTLGMGCGDSSADGEGGSGAGSNEPEYSCCVEDVDYACPDKAASDKCWGFGVFGCLDDCPPKDGNCAVVCWAQVFTAPHDTSDCQPDPNASACVHNKDSNMSSCTPTLVKCESSSECCEGLTCKVRTSASDVTFCLE